LAVVDSDVLRQDRLYVDCHTDNDIPNLLKCSGEDNLVIGSNYGHNDNSSELLALRSVQSESGLGEASTIRF
jgi:hypothetical protein